MNTPLPYLLLALALIAGCTQPPKDERVDGSGVFTLSNTAGTVFWGHQQDSTTNDIQVVLMLPESDQVGSGSQSHKETTYDYCDLKTKKGGHQWKIEAFGGKKTGIASLRFTDSTANTVTNLDLSQGRFWQISDDGSLVRLDKIEPTISERILHESEFGYKQIQALR